MAPLPSWTFRGLSLTAALSLLSACHSASHESSPGAHHPYPPPGDFGVVGTGGTATGVDRGPSGDGQANTPLHCQQERIAWKDWNQGAAAGVPSPNAAFAAIDHEVKTPLFWLAQDRQGDQAQRTHLTINLSIDPQSNQRTPTFVKQTPSRPETLPGDCPSYWELPVLLNLSTADLILQEQRVAGTLQIGSGGVSQLFASLDPRVVGPLGVAGQSSFTGANPTGSTEPDSTLPGPRQDGFASLELSAWLAKGILWAKIQGESPSGGRVDLADGHADDPRCEDGRRLKVGLDHPLGKLSAQRVISALSSFPEFSLQWEGQNAQSMRLAAIAPPREVCIEVLQATGPRAALDLPLRMTFVDDEQQRSLTITPNVRAALEFRGQRAMDLELRYNAFSRGSEGPKDFLNRHGMSWEGSDIPESGIFEFAMRLRNEDPKSLKGSVALVHFAQNPNCAQNGSDSTGNSQCDSLHGSTLRTGTFSGMQNANSN